jgi:hypothetical protein
MQDRPRLARPATSQIEPASSSSQSAFGVAQVAMATVLPPPHPQQAVVAGIPASLAAEGLLQFDVMSEK